MTQFETDSLGSSPVFGYSVSRMIWTVCDHADIDVQSISWIADPVDLPPCVVF